MLFESHVTAPLVGHTDSFVKDSAHFVQILEGLKMSNNSLMVSFDIKSLFTNVPVDEALQVIRIGLEDDDLLVSRTMLSVDSIIELLTLRQRISHMKTASTNRQTVRRWVPLFPPLWLTYTWNSLNKKHWN